MDRQQKLTVLGQRCEHEQDGLPARGPRPASSKYGIYTARSARGDVPIMRTLMTSSCAQRCGYCPFGLDVDFRRATWKREELVRTTLELAEADLARGIFLTSGLAGNAVRVMDWMLDVARALRERHAYRGYIHLKILPGAEDAQVEEALRFADRVSVNLEAPTDQALARIAPGKSLRGDLAERLKRVARSLRGGGGPRGGLVTQFVVGPGQETDRTLLEAASRLYGRHGVRRVYYSAFTPVLGTPFEAVAPESPTREVRLYQADWLLRYYGFRVDELPLGAAGELPRDRDPKLAWALQQAPLFPLEVNRAPRELLLRVPGLGPTSVERILRARRQSRLRSPDDLARLGVRARRTQAFLLFDGKYFPAGLRYFESAPVQLELFRFVRGYGRLPEDRRRVEPAAGGTYL